MKGWLIYDEVGRMRNGWFIDRLISCAANNKLNLELIRAEDLVFGVKDGKIEFYVRGREVAVPDFAICRTIFPLLSKSLEKAGAHVYNSALVSAVCNDKRATHLYFANLGIPMAATCFCDKTSFCAQNYDYPAVLKSVDGHGGKEVYMVNSPEEAERTLNAVAGKGFLLQKPVKKGEDVRVYLLNGRILAAVKRRSEIDFRSNFSRGGKAELVMPTGEMEQVTSLVYQQLRPMFVGVDFVFDMWGNPLLNEIEDVVGTRMLYELTNLHAADLFIDEIVGDLSKIF